MNPTPNHGCCIRSIPVMLCITVIMILQGCSTTNIISRYDCNTMANNPLNKRTTWSFAWGLIQPKDINPKCDSNFNHMNKVVVKTNLAFILLSAVTLGGVIPQRIEWCCAAPVIPPDTLGRKP